jgi:predicted nucleotidyltransferase
MISLRSKVARKILNYFFINPQESLYVNELSRKLEVDKRNLVKKLRELELAGILKSENRGNMRLYSMNPGFPLYKEYEAIVLKTIGLEEKVKRITKEAPGITEAYLYGSYAHNQMNAHSDIDLLFVGNHDIIALQKKLNKLQNEINREINSVSIDRGEFNRRIKNKDPFITEILKNKHIRLKG